MQKSGIRGVALCAALLPAIAQVPPALADPLRFDVIAETLPVDRSGIRSAEIVWQHGEPAVLIRLSDAMAESFARLTAAHLGRSMQIVIDDRIVTSAIIVDTIAGGQIILSGQFEMADAKRILLMLTDPCPPGDTAKCARRNVENSKKALDKAPR